MSSSFSLLVRRRPRPLLLLQQCSYRFFRKWSLRAFFLFKISPGSSGGFWDGDGMMLGIRFGSWERDLFRCSLWFRGKRAQCMRDISLWGRVVFLLFRCGKYRHLSRAEKLRCGLAIKKRNIGVVYFLLICSCNLYFSVWYFSRLYFDNVYFITIAL